MQRPIDKPLGTPAPELDTPALMVDVERLDAATDVIPKDVRIEAWVHKTPAIALRQLERSGALGIAVRSLAEAEVFAEAGCDDVRVLRPVVTATEQARAERLAEVAKLTLHDDGLPLCGASVLDEATSVSCCVTSVPQPGRAIVDCGQKAVGRDTGESPTLATDHGDRGAVRVSVGSAEHGILSYPSESAPFVIGDWLALRPADIATAFALHDFVYATRAGVLEAVWPVAARGCF